ncbi:hypothetical protein ES332_A13G192900v1 [Gossypium tomentosum]|uniref:Uncharacterized protein n=1 Tax=Gossypium tomentosum TaxID=34277 RepID=A0A5D2MMB9_GOSTO|nr:hypothetical protein ES332_A13G192900v1 [Gossypium tomentosum]
MSQVVEDGRSILKEGPSKVEWVVTSQPNAATLAQCSKLVPQLSSKCPELCATASFHQVAAPLSISCGFVCCF